MGQLGGFLAVGSAHGVGGSRGPWKIESAREESTQHAYGMSLRADCTEVHSDWDSEMRCERRRQSESQSRAARLQVDRARAVLVEHGEEPAREQRRGLGSAGSRGQGGQHDGEVGRWPPNSSFRIVWKGVRRCSGGVKKNALGPLPVEPRARPARGRRAAARLHGPRTTEKGG